MSQFYGPDLAAIHDQGFGFLARAAAAVLLARLKPGDHVVELGCGSGILTELLLQAGCRVTAVDYSADMLAIARGRAEGAAFVQGSVYNVEIPQCNAVCLIGEIVNYCAATEPSMQMLASLFAKIRSSLRSGGVLLFDSAGPGRSGGKSRGFVATDDWAVLYSSQENEAQTHMTRDHDIFARDGELYRRGSEVHTLRLWPPGELSSMLSDLGFQVEQLSAYGTLTLPTGLTGFLATA